MPKEVCVVAVNRFETDTQKEVEFIKTKAREFGADDCRESNVWEEGSKGGLELARGVIEVSKKPTAPKCLYSADHPIKEKIRIVASSIFGAKDVSFSESADSENRVIFFTRLGQASHLYRKDAIFVVVRPNP